MVQCCGTERQDLLQAFSPRPAEFFILDGTSVRLAPRELRDLVEVECPSHEGFLLWLITEEMAARLDPAAGIDDFIILPSSAHELLARVRLHLWKSHRVDAGDLIFAGDLVIAGGLGLALAAHAVGAAAHGASPAAAPGIPAQTLAPGVTAEVLAGVPSARAPGQTLYVARFVFQPGKAIFPHRHPGTTALGVAAGSLGWTLVKGTAHVVRGAAASATGPTEDLSTPGADVVLRPGDAIYYEDDVVHTARGAGSEPAIVLGSLLLTAGAPLLMPMAMGTPAATPST
jgi:quercetin dioxygenase-like cupin family protein